MEPGPVHALEGTWDKPTIAERIPEPPPMTLLARIAAIAIAVAIASVVQAQTAETAAPPPAPAAEVAVQPKARDADIARRIQNILEATGWYRSPAVRADDGVVFLDGATDSAERRKWAADLAQKTEDVTAVVNRIEIERPVAWAFDPALRELANLGRAALGALPLVLLAIVVLPLAWILSRFFGRLARRLFAIRVDSPLLLDVLAAAVAAPVFLLGLYVVLQVAGLTGLAFSVLGGAGVIGIVVGFAFRDIGENFLASLLLSVRRPFRAGDLVRVADQMGFVQSLNARSTLLLSPEGNHVQIPNATVFKNIIVNFSTAPVRRETFRVGIGYDASITQAQAIVLDAIESHQAILRDPAPLVLVQDLGSSTVVLEVQYWFDGQAFSQARVRSAILRLAKKALVDAGISMPDDAREVIFPEGLPLRRWSGTDAAAPAEAPAPPAAESAAAATESEGDLANERAEIEANTAAAEAEVKELGPNLLEERPRG